MIENALDQHGRQAQRRLVQQHQAGLGDQRPAYRQHLLLAARQIARQPAAPRTAAGVAIPDRNRGARRAPAQRVGGRHQVLPPRSGPRTRAALPSRCASPARTSAAACPAVSLPWKRMAPLTSAPSSSSSSRDTAFSVVDLPPRCCPAKATMPPRGTLQRQAPQHLHGLVVDHFDVVDGQHRRGGCRHGRLNPARSNPETGSIFFCLASAR